MNSTPKNILFILLFNVIRCFATDSDSTQMWKYKIGGKFTFGRTACHTLYLDEYPVYNPSVQVLFRIKNTCWSFQTGLCKTSKVINHNDKKNYYNFAALPLNMRFDKRGFYGSGGLFIDHLISPHDRSLYEGMKYPDAGVNHTLGFEKQFKNKTSLFVEMNQFFSLLNPFYYWSLGYSSYGIAFGVNYALK